MQLYHDLFDLLNGQLAYFLSFSRQCYKEYPWTFPFACLSLSAGEFLEISQKDYALTDIGPTTFYKESCYNLDPISRAWGHLRNWGIMEKFKFLHVSISQALLGITGRHINWHGVSVKQYAPSSKIKCTPNQGQTQKPGLQTLTPVYLHVTP